MAGWTRPLLRTENATKWNQSKDISSSYVLHIQKGTVIHKSGRYPQHPYAFSKLGLYSAGESTERRMSQEQNFM
jgi:hypothetical protein